MEIGKLKAYYLKYDLKEGNMDRPIIQALLCSAHEGELNHLLGEYLGGVADPDMDDFLVFLRDRGVYGVFID